MRKITEIILHCTGTVPSRSITIDSIRRYHVRVKGWSDIGYHFLIDADGNIFHGRPIEHPGAHCEGRNQHSIGIAYVGGKHYDCETHMDTRTDEQKKALINLIKHLMFKYEISIDNIRCHNEFSPKACPCFSPQTIRKELLLHI